MLLARLVVLVARVLATRSPARIEAVLRRLRGRARPAGYSRAQTAFDDVMAVSVWCRGPEGCLPRSIAVALLCRCFGTWPSWCVGARTVGPFNAHAWIEAQGRVVGERFRDDYYRTLFAVRPVS
ncbi:lasso peptide biosynthesis B2 protein [Allokutzneria oryzae]|uniref:Lasso peptide biosynthesis B2 protein n=1 Tax=Allokutzneria oryzae TaxID=1378989 RepID=A0ABV6A8P4_9PSEU